MVTMVIKHPGWMYSYYILFRKGPLVVANGIKWTKANFHKEI